MPQIYGFIFSAAAIPPDIGARLKQLREGLNWKQSELAERSGIAMGTISKIENYQEVDGICMHGRKPRAGTLLRLLGAIYNAGADFELKEVVPDWPEATPGRPFGYGQLSNLRRRELRLSLEEVAARAEIDNATLSRFERNATPYSTLYKFVRTAIGDIEPELCSIKLAQALGFGSVEEHHNWCIDREDNLRFHRDPLAKD